MRLRELIKDFDYECLSSDKLIKEEDIPFVEKELNVKIGPQLKEYILDFGYLSYSYAELDGVYYLDNTIKSDMISHTKRLHENWGILKEYIVIQSIDSHYLTLVDEEDNVYKLIYVNGIQEFTNKQIKLNDYILQYFEELKNENN